LSVFFTATVASQYLHTKSASNFYLFLCSYVCAHVVFVLHQELVTS